MKTDPTLRERLCRDIDPLPLEVETRLEDLHRRARGRELRRRGGVMFVAAAIAVLAALVLWQLRPADGGDQTAPGTEAPLPDGAAGTVAYTIEEPSGAAHHMALVDADGTGIQVLPDAGFGIGDDTFDTWFPRISPDGTQLAYLVETDGGGARALISNDLEGGDPVVLGERGSITGLAWSPDGSRIAYVAYAEPTSSFDVFIAQADDRGGVERVASGNWHEVAWSPAGDRLVLSGWPANDAGTGHDDLYLLDPASGDLTQLTDDEQRDEWPSWSPDGSTIVFARQTDPREDFAVDLYTVTAAGGEPTPLLEAPGYQGYPVWSPDGAQILFASFGETAADRDAAIENEGPLGTSLRLVTLESGRIDTLLDGGEDNLIPSSWVAGRPA